MASARSRLSEGVFGRSIHLRYVRIRKVMDCSELSGYQPTSPALTTSGCRLINAASNSLRPFLWPNASPSDFVRLQQTGRIDFDTLIDWFDEDFPGPLLAAN